MFVLSFLEWLLYANPCNITYKNGLISTSEPTKTLSSFRQQNPTNTMTTIEQPKSTNAVNHTNKFVSWNGYDFVISNKKFVPVGFNAYWLGLMEDYTYPSHSQIEEVFKIAERIGATVIRSHTLAVSSGSNNSLRPIDNKLNENAWEPIDYAFYIKLIVPLTDSYSYYHGNYGDFCKTRGVPKESFWTDMIVRSDFKQYIELWLNHKNVYTQNLIKNDHNLFLIELGNELGNIRPNADSNSIPTEDWIKDISSFIKQKDPNHLILHGVDESLGQNNDFNIKSIDVFSGHFYGKDYTRIDFGADSSKAVGKPYIIGEYDSNFQDDWFYEIEKRQNVKGTVFWNVYPHTNGYLSGQPIPHDDGYTLHYPENNDTFTRISKHFSMMKNRI